jgi:galactonate dehydratase
VYTHLGFGDMTSVYESMDHGAVVERGLQVIEKGYRALKVVFIPYTHFTASPKQQDHVGGMMQKLREAVGDEIEIMIDFHGRPASTSAALQYIHALAPSRPLFVEEPIQPGDAPGMKQILDKSPVPIAAGERLVDRREFDDLFRVRAINIAQPDLCHVGGFTEARKIAAMADTAGIGIAPHNPLGPLAGVAALHFDIATPNFVIQEEMSGAVPWYHEVVRGPIRMQDGYWQIPNQPGLGVEVDEKAIARHPFKQEVMHAGHAVLDDGTIVDW